MLVVRGLGKVYGDRTAVGAVDLDVGAGEIVGLLGPNGAGKTTLISMVAGVLPPSRGTVHIDGHDLGDRGTAARRAVGLVPQDLAFYEELSPRQNLAFFGRLYGLGGRRLAQRIEQALDVVGLTDRAGEPARRFSGGMKRRLNLAAGLVHAPRLLLLDEPTVGVDPQSRRHIFETLRALQAQGTAILYTSHYMEEVAGLCERVAIMDLGAVIAVGTVSALVAAHGEDVVDIEVDDAERAAAAAAPHADVVVDGAYLRVRPRGELAPVIAAVERATAIRRIASRGADLETAFLGLTGHSLRDP